jgi:hypothetical protein
MQTGRYSYRVWARVIETDARGTYRADRPEAYQDRTSEIGTE